MRDYIFRGKIKETKEWGYGSLLHITETSKGENIQQCNIFQIVTNEGVAFDVISETVGQYTGLEDKKQKPIFEGDIAKYPYGNVVGKIIYLHGSFVLSDFYDENEWDLTVIVDDIEVIDNIYDTQEELKEKL